MYRVNVELNGCTDVGGSDLLMHNDNLTWRDEMDLWLQEPLNKNSSRAGDDRSPAWRWLGYCYHDGEVVGIPSDNLMTCMRGGATMINVPGKGKKTYKAQSQSGLLVNEILWPITVNDGQIIKWEDIASLANEEDFNKHVARANELGIELFVKSVRIGQSKNIRVRPRFKNWKAKGSITVLDDTITIDLLKRFLECSGMLCGLCDWRPSSPRSPGPFGKFVATVTKAK